MAGLLDFIESPKGIGLLSAVAGGLATARRGTPINNIGRGVVAGLTGYQNAQNNIFEQQDRALQRSLYKQQIEAQLEGIRAKQAEAAQAKEEGRYWLASMGVDPENLQGSFMHVSNDSIPATAYKPQPKQIDSVVAAPQQETMDLQSDTPLVAQQGFSFTPPPQTPKPPPIDAVLDELGYSGGKKQYFYSFAKSNPEKAAEMLSRQLDAHMKAQWKGKSEARDVIAKERAIAEAMGMPLGEYLREKTSKSGVNVTVPVNVMTEKAAEQAGKKEGWDIGEQAAAIENKWSAIDSVREAKDIMKQGIYSGYWGDIGKTVSKASMGAIGDRHKAARTEQFMSHIGNVVIPRLKEFGGNDSNEEMRYLQRVMGGDITMEPEAISAILDSAERKIARGIERLQRQRGALEQGRMPDLGPGPSRNPAAKPAQTRPATIPSKPSVSNW